MKFLGRCVPYVKRYSQEPQWSAFLFMAQITQILLYLGMPLLEKSKITVWYRHLFKKNCFWSFRYLSTLRKKVFSRVPVKCFSLYSSNSSDSVVFGNADFSEINDRSWSTIDFLKISLKRFNFWKKVFGWVNNECSFWYLVFFENRNYPEYLFLNIQPKTMCRCLHVSSRWQVRSENAKKG